MKRNMLAIVILAATLINLSLSAVLIFTIVPKAKRTDALIEKIVKAVELDTESNIGISYGEVAPADQEEIVLFKEKVINLKSTNDKVGYAQVTVTLTLNKKHTDYATVQPLISSKEEKIVSALRTILNDYTAAEVTESATEINKRTLDAVIDIFKSDVIIEATVNIFAVEQ